jgi:hypothetical protein
MTKLKFLLSLALLLVWGPYLLYIWIFQAPVPAWSLQPGFRRALMLGGDYEPTIFTLLFGLAFSGFALFGLVGLLTGRGRFHD